MNSQCLSEDVRRQVERERTLQAQFYELTRLKEDLDKKLVADKIVNAVTNDV